MKVFNIVGARPNFMKVAPINRAFEKYYPDVDSKVIHTGQHYDEKMSDIFFKQLNLPKPYIHLGVNGGSHTEQTAKVMLAFEQLVNQEKPDLILVVGDVNSTLATSLVAKKMGIPLAHVESGLRSFDRAMPEELNRILTDSVSDYLFVSEPSGLINLSHEGVPAEKQFFVGNVMIDSLVYYIEQARKTSLRSIFTDSGIPFSTDIPSDKSYFLMTMHRPANVDNKKSLEQIIQIIKYLSSIQPVVFPIHPRTKNNLAKFGLQTALQNISNLFLLPPQGYLQFLLLMDKAKAVITDSGGIQEETTFLKVPCLTLRDSTERPITTEIGSNTLINKLSLELIQPQIEGIIRNSDQKLTEIPALWDGKTAERITRILTS
jgi:UDP-N-acetylglucosamine 2-epimerase (non-hydrolysing)